MNGHPWRLCLHKKSLRKFIVLIVILILVWLWNSNSSQGNSNEQVMENSELEIVSNLTGSYVHQNRDIPKKHRKLEYSTIIWNLTADSHYQSRTVDSSSVQTSKKIGRWIVVTSISDPTDQIARLASIPGFTMLVVADLKTPKNWNHPGVIFLSVEQQSKLDYNILNHVPWNAYTRKMIGYLYAIERGAKVIYDTDDDNAPDTSADFLANFDFDDKSSGLIPKKIRKGKMSLFNPYAHFGRPEIWPRGYPLEVIGRNQSKIYTACKFPAPAIQQGLVNGDPDVDAIYRLTQKKHYQSLDIRFDKAAPRLVYNYETFAPFNSQNTLFKYESFWALMLPVSVTFRVTDIWRSYWAQPLLWKSGSRLGFYPARTTQIRNPHNFLKDFAEEDKLYKESGKFVDFLFKWGRKNCFGTQPQGLYSCMLQLSKDMADNGFWGPEDFLLTQAWIDDLEKVGYKTPTINENLRASTCLPVTPASTVRFQGVSAESKSEENENERPEQCTTRRNSYNVLQKFCNHSLPNFPNKSGLISRHGNFNQTLLIIAYNFQHFNNIFLLDNIYRPFFPNILYCGETLGGIIIGKIEELFHKEEFIQAGVNSVSFLQADVNGGGLSYSCFLRAIDMNYGVEEYILMADDVLFQFWKTVESDSPQSTWHLEFSARRLRTDKFGKEGNPNNWYWWEHMWGRSATVAAFKALEAIVKQEIEDENSVWIKEFAETREKKGYNFSVTSYGSGDFYKVPKKMFEIFSSVGWILKRHNVFAELAVPILFSGLGVDEKIIDGTWLWFRNRSDPFTKFDMKGGIVHHPLKFGELEVNETLKMEFCKHFLSVAVSV